jgi:hypothetical protein
MSARVKSRQEAARAPSLSQCAKYESGSYRVFGRRSLAHSMRRDTGLLPPASGQIVDWRPCRIGRSRRNPAFSSP